MTTRYLPPMVGAVAMTFGLFFVMQLLVSGQMILPPQFDDYVVNVPRIEPAPPPKKVDDALPDKVEVTHQPDGPTDISEPRPDVPPGPVKVSGPGTAPSGTGKGGPASLAPADDEMVPLFIVQPAYPSRPQMNGVEGYVVLEFAVDELGNVKDPRVLYAEPQGMFGRAAIRAIERSRFKARVIDGSPVAVVGVRYKYVFEIK